MPLCLIQTPRGSASSFNTKDLMLSESEWAHVRLGAHLSTQRFTNSCCSGGCWTCVQSCGRWWHYLDDLHRHIITRSRKLTLWEHNEQKRGWALESGLHLIFFVYEMQHDAAVTNVAVPNWHGSEDHRLVLPSSRDSSSVSCWALWMPN